MHFVLILEFQKKMICFIGGQGFPSCVVYWEIRLQEKVSQEGLQLFWTPSTAFETKRVVSWAKIDLKLYYQLSCLTLHPLTWTFFLSVFTFSFLSTFFYSLLFSMWCFICSYFPLQFFNLSFDLNVNILNYVPSVHIWISVLVMFSLCNVLFSFDADRFFKCQIFLVNCVFCFRKVTSLRYIILRDKCILT